MTCQVVTLTSAPPAPGAECVTAGWGTHTTSGLFMTNILQRLSATIVDKEECNTVSIQHYIYLAQAQGQDKVTLRSDLGLVLGSKFKILDKLDLQTLISCWT